tara:strand:+ start:134 stop:370 length:237 start_codon:yes stop_codon:yes gene_type:complete
MPTSVVIFILGIMFITVGIPVLSNTVLKLNKQMHDRHDSKTSNLDKEEAILLNDLHSGLERMEKRIESLETILMEKRR